MASDHSHGPQCHHHDSHAHSESCENDHNHQRPPRVFTRSDLLRNYQTLERIASMLPPQLLEQELVVQMDALVGALEHHLLHVHSDSHCDHDHGHDEKDHQEHDHEHHHHHADIDPFEEELKEDLSLMQYRARIREGYTPLHPSVYDFNNWPIAPTLKQLIERHPAHLALPKDTKPLNYNLSHPLLRLMPTPGGPDIRDIPETLRRDILNQLNEVSPGVFVFDFLPPDFCLQLLEEIDSFESWCKKVGENVHRPNSMNNYGAILDDFGFESCLEQMVSQVMNVLSSVAYPYIGATLDHHHGFVVAYEMGKDETLDMHVDDADVTLNVCLGKEFTKGDLLFTGVRCNHHQSTTHPLEGEVVSVPHRIGQACMHVGRHRHAATGIASGERFNLILWCRSSKFRRLDTLLDCPNWCPISALIDAQTEPPADEPPTPDSSNP